MRDDVAVVLDPVADGKPSFSRITVIFIVAMFALAAWQAYTGEYFDAAKNLLWAGMFYLFERIQETAWMNGYNSAALAIHEQAGVDGDDD